ncbi:MAG: c-type cytochrome [Bacteroidia bacterium]|nr:c-type cytochrome [Bacteroidia bacterium]
MKNRIKSILVLCSLLVIAIQSYAETTGTDADQRWMLEAVIVMTIGVAVLVFGILAMGVLLIYMTRVLVEKTTNQPARLFPEIDLSYLWDRFTGAKTGAKQEILLDHDYDGIQELDNPPPPLFNYLFYGTIVFSIIYLIYYHMTDAPLMEAEYHTEMAIAQQKRDEWLKTQAANIDETNVQAAKDAGTLANGKAIFMQYCAACHGNEGEGKVGPNLTDDYWLHGGNLKDIFKTIKYGVPAKGMISWQQQLSPLQIQEVSNYIVSLRGTKPANPKEPQGVPFVPEESTPKDTTKLTSDSTR